MSPAEFRAARTALGLSVAGMAKRLGVSPTHIRRMEMDEAATAWRPVTKTVERLIRAYLDGYRPPDWGVDLSFSAHMKRNVDRKTGAR